MSTTSTSSQCSIAGVQYNIEEDEIERIAEVVSNKIIESLNDVSKNKEKYNKEKVVKHVKTLLTKEITNLEAGIKKICRILQPKSKKTEEPIYLLKRYAKACRQLLKEGILKEVTEGGRKYLTLG